MAKDDRETVMRGRRQYNEALLDLHQRQLDDVVEAAEIDSSARLTTHAMQKAVEVDDVATYLAAGRSPALELALREYQAAHNHGEMSRIIKRAYGL